MKKLLVLALVLSMASIASATLSLNVTGTLGTENVALIAAGETADSYIAIGIEGPDAAIGSFVAGPQAGTMAGMVGTLDMLMAGGKGEIWAMAIGVPPEVYQDGTWLTAAVTHTAAATLTLYSYDGDVTLTPMQTIVLPAPEPMTLGLLGLGGLFLRRRK